MLDAEIKEQLKGVFGSLTKRVILVFDESPHSAQTELLEMLHGLKETSSLIEVRSSGQQREQPCFYLEVDGKRTGVSFRAVPGGHEFTSLVLAILNSNGLGKLPDQSTQDRVRRLKGPISVKTYMSLSCENCPDVVQALNQMALIHPQFSHEVVDGALADNEVEALGIQGVPSVIVNEKMLHSGRITLMDLIAKLENHFGTSGTGQAKEPAHLGHFDVIVIGGGPAGASAAIYSARKGLKTGILAERMGGQVQDTKGIENLISVVYTEGPELSAQLRKHVETYDISVFEQRRVSEIDASSPKKILLEGGDWMTTDAVIVSTGAKWRELNVPGEKEYMGRGVAYCPHCDGPFYKGKKVAVIGGGNSGVEAAIDLAGIVAEVVLIEYADALRADKVLVDKLMSLSNTSVVSSAKTTEIVGNGKKVVGLKYVDRKTENEVQVDLDGVFIQIGLLPNTGFLKDVVELTKLGEIVVDPKGRTSVKGIYAAGDATTVPYKQIVIAMGEGAKAALAAFEDRMYAH
ncbi:MAG: alkyl hydroperoxide reductase subunit F [Oligoflexia bacterium]|nr:alkyl hydroperoxide reductase subunit F [Oligoflexia bacterium]